MHMALASFFDSHAADAVFPAAAMAYHRRPCSGGGFPPAFHYGGAGSGSSSSSPAAAFFPTQSAFGLAPPPQQQPAADAFESLSDEGVSPAVPVAFGTPPPPRMPVEQVVPDVVSGGYSHARGAAAAVAEEGSRRTTDRIAFRVRSEKEVLEDGYKWRKYGKKSVKNSPNPRNYYRCSTEGCNVKKRVERDKDDPSYVVTMYEGVHKHVSPGTIYYATQDAASGRFFVAGMHQFGP